MISLAVNQFEELFIMHTFSAVEIIPKGMLHTGNGEVLDISMC